MNKKTWKLKRTNQCEKCPWRKDVDPHDIPNGYSEDKHKALEVTIAKEANPFEKTPNMACHETHDSHCIGWLNHQLGRGNNIGLRMQMMSCENASKIRINGEQHETFEDTLP